MRYAMPMMLSVVCATMSFAAGAADNARSASVWVSSVDMKSKLTPGEPVPFTTDRKPDLACIEIDPGQTFQPMIGIGSSLEHATCFNLSKLDPARRDKAIADLVNPETGIGMNLMRICIGTSDFTGAPWYSYDDVAAGETDPELTHFSIEKDRAYVLPVLKAALAQNPNLLFLASPWSPPGWMKDTAQMCGGRLLPEHYAAYARYLIRFIQAYEADGIPIYAITLQNEPGVNVRSYPSCFWNGDMQRDFIQKDLGPLLKQSGLKAQVWSFDHNFNNVAFPQAILRDPEAAQYVDGTAFHFYEGKPEAMGALAKEFPGKPVYFTEGSTYGVNGAVKIMSFFENMARSYNAWVTVIDNHGKPNNGPHRCSPTCIVLNSETLDLEYRFDYYMYGHFSKFIQRGAVRLGSTPSTPRFANVAFRNPDGAIVLVVANNEPEQKQFTIRCKDAILATALDRLSVATYRWQE